jgi:hypothetical protein
MFVKMFKINIYAFCVYALRVSATQGHLQATHFLRNPNGAQSGCNTKDRKNRHPVTPKLIIIIIMMTYFKSSSDKVHSALDTVNKSLCSTINIRVEKMYCE